MHGIARVGFNLELFLAVKHAVYGNSMILTLARSIARFFFIYPFQAPFCFCLKSDRENDYDFVYVRMYFKDRI